MESKGEKDSEPEDLWHVPSLDAVGPLYELSLLSGDIPSGAAMDVDPAPAGPVKGSKSEEEEQEELARKYFYGYKN
jgi:hypothetical protein